MATLQMADVTPGGGLDHIRVLGLAFAVESLSVQEQEATTAS